MYSGPPPPYPSGPGGYYGQPTQGNVYHQQQPGIAPYYQTVAAPQPQVIYVHERSGYNGYRRGGDDCCDCCCLTACLALLCCCCLGGHDC